MVSVMPFAPLVGENDVSWNWLERRESQTLETSRGGNTYPPSGSARAFYIQYPPHVISNDLASPQGGR